MPLVRPAWHCCPQRSCCVGGGLQAHVHHRQGAMQRSPANISQCVPAGTARPEVACLAGLPPARLNCCSTVCIDQLMMQLWPRPSSQCARMRWGWLCWQHVHPEPAQHLLLTVQRPPCAWPAAGCEARAHHACPHLPPPGVLQVNAALDKLGGGVRKVLIVGIETHVCVLQTTLDLLGERCLL